MIKFQHQWIFYSLLTLVLSPLLLLPKGQIVYNFNLFEFPYLFNFFKYITYLGDGIFIPILLEAHPLVVQIPSLGKVLQLIYLSITFQILLILLINHLLLLLEPTSLILELKCPTLKLQQGILFQQILD